MHTLYGSWDTQTLFKVPRTLDSCFLALKQQTMLKHIHLYVGRHNPYQTAPVFIMVIRKQQLQNLGQNDLVRKILFLKSTLSKCLFFVLSDQNLWISPYETNVVVPISNAMSQLADKNRDGSKLRIWIRQIKTQNKRLMIFLEVVSIMTHKRQCPTGWAVRGSNPSAERNFFHPSGPALGPTQPPIKWVPTHFSVRKATRTWRLPPTSSSAEGKEWVELYFYSTFGLHGVL